MKPEVDFQLFLLPAQPESEYFFFLQVLRLYRTLWVMTDIDFLYIHALAWLLPPF